MRYQSDTHGQRPNKRLTPTDIAQYVRLGECARYLKLRLHERAKGSKFLREYGVSPQSIPPLLTHSGQKFEARIEEAARRRFASAVINCADAIRDEEDNSHSDNQRVIDLTCALGPGETLVLFQPRLEAVLGEWPFTGDVDILRLDRDGEGRLSALIVDMKSTTRAKVEHRLQVAFYHRMLVSILGNAGVSFVHIDIGVVYRGPAQDLTPTEQDAQREAAVTYLGMPDALLEIVAAPQDYLYEVEDLVTDPESAAAKIARVRRFADLPWHLSYKCDGCLYNEFCLKDAYQSDDLSLIPYLSASDKRTLHQHGLVTVTETANLMRVMGWNGDYLRLVPSKGKEEAVVQLRASSLGPRLDEIVHRAIQVTRTRLRQEKRAQAAQEDVDQTKGATEAP